MLPISVQANVEAVNQHSLHRTLQFAPMIRDIHLVSSIYNIGPLIGTLKNPNRSLESLIVEVLRPDDNQDIRYSKRSISGNGPPLLALKHLELHRTPISLISPRFTGLTNLSLHHLPFSERPARQDFLALLERFQMLKHLTLVRAFPKNIVAGGHTSGRSIRLPNLITVSLTGSVQELVNMLECITLQPAGRLHCHVDRLGDFKTHFWRLAKVIGSHFHDAAWAMPLDTLVMTGREDGLRFTNDHEMSPLFQQTLRIRAFGVTGTVEPLLDLVIGPDVHTSHDEVIVATLGSMWDALPLTYVHTLTLQSLDVITQKSWPRLLTALHSLRVIDIGGRPPSGLIWALFLNARSHSHLEHDDLSSILLPKLEDIYLHNVDCHAGGLMVSSSAPINSHYDLDDSQFLEVLYAYFEDRQRCTLDLRSLSISRCQNVSNQILNDLRGTVSYLSWDNRGLFKGDINSRSPATYRTHWPSKPPTLRHYFRLCTLLGSD